MSKNKLLIQNITISLCRREFDFYNSDSEEKKNKVLQEIENFRKEKTIIDEKEEITYKTVKTLYYYSGRVEFKPFKQDQSEIKTTININQNDIDSVIAMCLNKVCELGEKQIKAFQQYFISYVSKNQKSVEKASDNIKEGFLKRVGNKLLNNE